MILQHFVCIQDDTFLVIPKNEGLQNNCYPYGLPVYEASKNACDRWVKNNANLLGVKNV